MTELRALLERLVRMLDGSGIPLMIAGSFASTAHIDTLNVLGGHVPRRKLRLATDWIDAHRAEIHALWEARNPV
jgi:hypothetical protein